MYLTFIGCLYFFITASGYFPSFQPAVLFIISYRASLVVTTFLNFYLPATKSLQSCLTLYDLIDGSPPGSSVHGIFQARVLEWGAITFSLFTWESLNFIFKDTFSGYRILR